jgi:hypothetical protein
MKIFLRVAIIAECYYASENSPSSEKKVRRGYYNAITQRTPLLYSHRTRHPSLRQYRCAIILRILPVLSTTINCSYDDGYRDSTLRTITAATRYVLSITINCRTDNDVNYGYTPVPTTTNTTACCITLKGLRAWNRTQILRWVQGTYGEL